MLSWVSKVVPQPPEKKEPEKPPPVQLKPPPKVQEAPKAKVKSPKAAKKTKQPDQESTGSPISGKRVLSWISESLSPPQPVKADGKEENGMTRSPSMTSVSSNKEQGVLGRIVTVMEVLETVVPLPQPVAKEEPEEPSETEEYDEDEMPDAEPLPHIPAIEVESADEEEEEEDDPTKPFPPRVIKKIKRTLENLVPQPEIYINADGKVQKKKKGKASAEAENGSQQKVVGWIVQEFGRILPQPAGKDGDEVQKRG